MIASRSQLLATLFPQGVPSLWCPPLTHYTAEGAIDRPRIAAHLRFLSRWAKGLLVPGTTGDGWELTPDEIGELISIMLDEVPRLGVQLLWGALDANADQARQRVAAGLAVLQERSGIKEMIGVLAKTHVCGFTVCPPRGPTLSELEIESGLASVLELGIPLALYQLPQFTQNEVSPASVARLAARHPNFLLFKDTSGGDRVACSGADLGGVFLVRGMEGQYARWLKAGGGCYDGFLLSAANSFGQPLQELRQLLELGRPDQARALSERLSSVIAALFGIVDSVPGGNKFTNGNKLADHFFAHGPKAAAVPPPRLHSGAELTVAMLQAAGSALDQHGFMPARGYLE